MLARTCVGCGTPFTPHARERNPRKWCSESCRVRQYRPISTFDRACAHCDAPFTSSDSRTMYCSDLCSSASRNGRRRMPQSFVCGDCGADFQRRPVRGRRPKWCLDCRRKRRQIKVPASVRAAVYERDAGICRICTEPVDMAAARGTDWAPTIDHVVCQSWQVEPDHSLGNLRLAHHWCNSVRGDERAYTVADFAMVA